MRGYQLRHLSKLSRIYLFAGAGPAVLAGGTAAFAFVSVAAGADVLAFASDVFALDVGDAGASTGASGLLESTETLPFSAGIANSSADNIKVVAATMVTFERTVAVPRGLNAELETLLVNNAPASVLPGCSKTAATRTMQERKNTP